MIGAIETLKRMRQMRTASGVCIKGYSIGLRISDTLTVGILAGTKADLCAAVERILMEPANKDNIRKVCVFKEEDTKAAASTNHCQLKD